MRAVISSVVWGSLMVVVTRNSAHGQSVGEDTEGGGILIGDSSTSSSEESGESSLMEEAQSTGTIFYRSERVRRFFGQECHTPEVRKYRTADGSCNHPFNLGTAGTPFKRLLPSRYGDSINSPRSHGKDGSPLPSATEVSRIVIGPKNHSSTRTTMFVQWGQFIDHDITLTPVHTMPHGAIRCCEPDGSFPVPFYRKHPACFPILLGRADSDTRFSGSCMEFVRSMAAHHPYGLPIIPREQVNDLTSFLDGSVIYGSSQGLQRDLREVLSDGTTGARMRTSGDRLLPKSPIPDCIPDQNYCFMAGDERVNVQPGLMAIHTMWVRLHNLIVDSLRPLRPDDSEEQLFQETRKVVVALLQNIHYKEWLPLLIGNKMQSDYRLSPNSRPCKRVGYSSHMDPRIANAFSAAAFRFGHSALPSHLLVNGKTSLMFDDYDGIVKSLVSTDPACLAQKVDKHIVDDLKSHLFEPVNQTDGAPSHGLDLAALNIQRGRDHGLPPFNEYRKLCGLPPITNFTDLGDKIGEKIMSKNLYGSVDDIDLFVGGLLERPEVKYGAFVGPTFACIIGQQFHALKYGDRFYFETDRMPEGFNDDQLQEIRRVTFAHICCLTANISTVQGNVFRAEEKTLNCEDLRNDFLSFILWKKYRF